MPATTGKAIPITTYKVTDNAGGVATEQRELEKAAQTFLQGTPVQYDVAGVTGYIIACPAMTSVATAHIAGFSVEPASNLASSGTPKTLTYGSVQNQPSAVLIPVGAPLNDGTVGFVVAQDGTWFRGVMGDSADNTLAVLAQAMVGAIFGLFKDPGNNFWYVDHNVTTAAGGACVEVTELIDPVGTLNGRVGFKVLKAAQQLGA